MSKENVEIVRRVVEAYASGDFDACWALIDPEVELDGRARPEGKVYRGHAGIADALRTWTGTFEAFRAEVEDIIDGGDRIVAFERQSGRGKASGVRFEQETAMLYTVQGGKIVRMVWFSNREAALEAAGLSE